MTAVEERASSNESVNPEPRFFACLYAPEFPAQALLRLRHGLRGRPVAVLEGHAPQERVCAANAFARRDGVLDGMTRVEAESFAGMVLLRRSLREEAEARGVLLACAAKYTPGMEEMSSDREAICVFDLGGTEKLFGPPLALAERLRTELRGFGLCVSIALSVNFHTALALARAGQAVTLTAPGDERQALAPLLLSVLPLSAEQLETLALWGIRTLSGLAALPERALIARMGQSGKRLRALARGEQSHLFQPAHAEFVLRESYEFEAPVAVMDSLLFVLAPMLDQLLLRARERALSLASLDLLLLLERDPHTGAAREHRRAIRPALPTEDRRLLLKLIQLDLDAYPPAAAVMSLEVTAEPGKGSKVQLGLFSPQLPESSRLDVTLARLRALVGEGCVGSPRLLDTYRPDSFAVEGFGLTSHAASERDVPAMPAIRRLRPPVLVSMRLDASMPASFWYAECQYQVMQAFGPWRASGSWWSATVWSREQWELIVKAAAPVSADKCGLSCLIAHDLLRQQWVMEAIYD